jgi:hypothetical protein
MTKKTRRRKKRNGAPGAEGDELPGKAAAMTTRVVTVRTCSPEDVIYVGRRVSRRRLLAHPLANPFKLRRNATPEEVGACLEKYQAWLDQWDPDQLRRELQALREEVLRTGLPLGCWCGNYPENPDLQCHAVVLARRIDAMA